MADLENIDGLQTGPRLPQGGEVTVSTGAARPPRRAVLPDDGVVGLWGRWVRETAEAAAPQRPSAAARAAKVTAIRWP